MLSRRNAIKMLAGAVPAFTFSKAFANYPMGYLPNIAPGPFTASRESLQAYEIPAWFKDAKFGIWAHWGPQSAPEYGDWYARNMYMQGSDQYDYHVKKYGHPSKFGFKDIIPTWKAEKFDPEYLVGLYKKAGAKYFMSMGVHHDNFDLWNSTYNRWNAVKMGPHKDIVGSFRQAAYKHGLKFGISDHLWISYKWFSTSHGADETGDLAGVLYDGADPAYYDFYHDIQTVHTHLNWDESGITLGWKETWFKRIKDLIDQYHPDLLYCDGAIPFEDWGLGIVAHLYNTNYQMNGGKVEAVYTSKRQEDSLVGTCVLDVERGVVGSIWPRPWQTDTCIGHWHYDVRAIYKTPKTIIDMLVDIVSRNGNLMLNFPLPSSGMLDDRELAILAAITDWMQVNSEAIYSTRPWKIFGYGPATEPAANSSSFNENKRPELTADDIRFTTKGKNLYAFFMGWPDNQQIIIHQLGLNSEYQPGKIIQVSLLGHDGQLNWNQDNNGLSVQLPAQKPGDLGYALKVVLA